MSKYINTVEGRASVRHLGSETRGPMMEAGQHRIFMGRQKKKNHVEGRRKGNSDQRGSVSQGSQEF